MDHRLYAKNFLLLCVLGFGDVLFADRRDAIGFEQMFRGHDVKMTSRLRLASPPIFIFPKNFLVPNFSFRKSELSFATNNTKYPIDIYEASVGMNSINKFDGGFSLTLIPVVSLRSAMISELFRQRGLTFLLVSSLGCQVFEGFELSVALVYIQTSDETSFLPGGALKYRSSDSKLVLELGYPNSRVGYFIDPQVELAAQFLTESLSVPLSEKSRLRSQTSIDLLSSRQMSIGPAISWNVYKYLWVTGGSGWIFYDKIKGTNPISGDDISSGHKKDSFLFFSNLGVRF